MNSKYLAVVFWMFFLGLSTDLALAAIDTAPIDRVRQKEVLDGEDFKIIDKFVGSALGEFVATWDFSTIADGRAVILSRVNSEQTSAAAQYSQQFTESIRKHLAAVLKTTETVEPQQRKFKVLVNLLILASELADTALSDLIVEYMDSPGAGVRYWAARCVSNPKLIKQLNSGENPQLLAKIIAKFKEIIEKSSSEVMVIAAKFAVAINSTEADELLLKMADVRMEKYINWKVENTLPDSELLIILCDKAMDEQTSNPAFGQKFAQLYSYAFQKYVANSRGGNFLSDIEVQQLASVLAETEKSCIGKITSVPQSVIKKAIDQGDYMTLLAEHDRLLGDRASVGKVAGRLGIDYGTDAAGNSLTAPLTLPPKPEN